MIVRHVALFALIGLLHGFVSSLRCVRHSYSPLLPSPLPSSSLVSSFPSDARYVQRELLKAELLFKLVATPPDIAPAALAANFRLYWPSGTDADLRRVAVLKGFSIEEEEEAVLAAKTS